MIFLIKKRKLVVDMFAHRQMIFDVAKPKMAAHFYPEWWKDLKTEMPISNDLFPTATMKRCMGLVDHYKHGIIQPLWSDFRIELGAIGDPHFSARFSDNTTTLSQHPALLRGTFAPESHYCHMKFDNPWVARCKEDVYFKWEQPTWNMTRLTDYVLMSGTTEFNYQYSMNVNLMFVKQPKRGILEMKFGQPLVHLTPLTERPVELRHHIVDKAEFDRFLQGEKLSNINRYRAYRRAREAEESKCPFGFGERKNT